jgi:hypothetical protein
MDGEIIRPVENQEDPGWFYPDYFPEVLMNVEFIVKDENCNDLYFCGYYSPINGGTFCTSYGKIIDTSSVVKWRKYDPDRKSNGQD